MLFDILRFDWCDPARLTVNQLWVDLWCGVWSAVAWAVVLAALIGPIALVIILMRSR